MDSFQKGGDKIKGEFLITILKNRPFKDTNNIKDIIYLSSFYPSQESLFVTCSITYRPY